MKNKWSYLRANMAVAILASSATMLFLLWKFPIVTAIATVGVVAFLMVSARLAATANDAESANDRDQSESSVSGLH
jgi:hypothetical protein